MNNEILEKGFDTVGFLKRLVYQNDCNSGDIDNTFRLPSDPILSKDRFSL